MHLDRPVPADRDNGVILTTVSNERNLTIRSIMLLQIHDGDA